MLRDLTSPEYAESIRKQINDTTTFTDSAHYGALFDNRTEYGTSHASFVAENGDAISVTTSVNYYFGSGITGKRTGIIFNSGMNDFSVPSLVNQFLVPPSPNNYIKPYKRSVSSMSPTIITDKDGNVSLVVGSAGGTKIVTGISQVNFFLLRKI